jgi:hypothetical protein
MPVSITVLRASASMEFADLEARREGEPSSGIQSALVVAAANEFILSPLVNPIARSVEMSCVNRADRLKPIIPTHLKIC